MAGSTLLAVTSTTFTDLGAAPVAIQVLGPESVTVVIADALPTVGTTGFVVIGNQGNPLQPIIFQQADASSHIYVAMYGGQPAAIVYSPVIGVY